MANIAILATDGYEDSELDAPVARLREAGHEVTIVGPRAGRIIDGKREESRVTIERNASFASIDNFDALVIPGGDSPAELGDDAEVLAFVDAFVKSGKPVCARGLSDALLARL